MYAPNRDTVVSKPPILETWSHLLHVQQSRMMRSSMPLMPGKGKGTLHGSRHLDLKGRNKQPIAPRSAHSLLTPDTPKAESDFFAAYQRVPSSMVCFMMTASFETKTPDTRLKFCICPP